MAVMMDVLFGPYRGQRIMMPDEDAAQAIADGWAVDPHAPPVEPPFDLSVEEHKDYVHEAAHVGSAKLRDLGTTPPAPLVLTSLSPAQATIGDPDVAMHVAGEGFTAACVITFNGGDEATTFVSATELTTIVRPSTAGVAGTYPVTVKRGADETASLGFTLIAVGDMRRKTR